MSGSVAGLGLFGFFLLPKEPRSQGCQKAATVSGDSRSLVFEGIDGFKGVLELACESGENLGAKMKDVYFLGTSPSDGERNLAAMPSRDSGKLAAAR